MIKSVKEGMPNLYTPENLIVIDLLCFCGESIFDNKTSEAAAPLHSLNHRTKLQITDDGLVYNQAFQIAFF